MCFNLLKLFANVGVLEQSDYLSSQVALRKNPLHGLLLVIDKRIVGRAYCLRLSASTAFLRLSTLMWLVICHIHHGMIQGRLVIVKIVYVPKERPRER